MVRWLVNTLVASMIFFPTRDYMARPQDFGLIAEDAWPETEDGIRLHGWYFDAGEAKTVLLLLHGNATNISGVLPHAKGWSEAGISVLLLDYRGYGQSGGNIKIGTDIFRDAEAGVQWLGEKKGFRRGQVVLYGQSVGSVPAVHLATKENFRAIVLQSPFTSVQEMAKVHYGFSFGFFLKAFPYENLEKIGSIKSPVFILHGTKDEVCPFWMGKRLFEEAPEPKEFFEIANGTHNDLLLNGGEFFSRPIAFVRGLEN